MNRLLILLLLAMPCAAQLTTNGIPNQTITGSVPPQNRQAGSLTLTTAPDNMNGDRYAFNLRNTPANEFDSSGGPPTLSNGIMSTTSFASRTYIGGTYTSFTDQCDLFATSGGTSECGTYNGTAVMGPTFSGLSFGYTDNAGTFHALATATNNTWYHVGLIAENGYAATYLCPMSTVVGCTAYVAQATSAGSGQQITVIASGGDQAQNIRYATDNVTGSSPPYPSMVAVPNNKTNIGEPLPVNLQVPSNPAGSQVNVLIILPSNYNPSVTTSWVFGFEGDGGHASDFMNAEGQDLLAAGYAIVASDYTSNTCWGNAACVSDIASALSKARLQFNLDPTPYCIAGSMGGMILLNAISHGAVTCRAAEMVYPAYSMSNIYAGGTGGFNSQLQTAFSCSSVPTCNAAFANSPNVPYDPSTVGAKVFSTIPFDVRCSASDTTINCAANGQALVTAVNAVGGASVFTACTGPHGDPSCVVPAAVIDFFKAH